MTLSGTLKVCDHLADSTAGIQLTEPFGSIRVGVIRRFELLHVHKNDRDIHVADSRKHVIRSRVGEKLADHQVDVRCAELVACRLGQLFGRDDPAVDDLYCVRNRLLERVILRLELGHERRELRQISAECDGKNADPCFCVYQHGTTLL